MSSNTVRLDPNLFSSFTDPNSIDWNGGGYQTGNLEQFFNREQVGSRSGGAGALWLDQEFMANQKAQNAQKMAESGLDPNGQYLWGIQRIPEVAPWAGSGKGQLKWGHNAYKNEGGTWKPVYSQATPHKGLTGKDFAKAVAIAAGFMMGGSALLGAGAGAGGAVGGTGISASTAGAATGGGMAALPGAGLALAAPTAGATGTGLFAGGLGGWGAGAGALGGLSSMYDMAGAGGGGGAIGDYSLTSAPNFSSSGGAGLNAGDFTLGDGWQGVFDNLSSPTISDYGALEFSPAATGGFLDSIGGNLGDSLSNGATTGTLLDQIRKRLSQGGQRETSPNLSRTLMDILRTGAGVRNANRGLDDSKGILDGLDANIRSLQDMFGPNSAFAQQMRQTLERKDAAAGRRSQYGPREVELQGALAREHSRIAPSLAALFSQKANIQNQSMMARNQRDNIVLDGIGRPVTNLAADLIGPEVENTIGTWLGNIFG